MNYKFSVLVGEVRAAMLFASNDESRYILNGVCFEASKDKPVRLIATNGRTLAVINSEAPTETDCPDDCQVVISSAFLKPLCAFAKSQASVICVEYHPSVRAVFHLVGSDCVVDSEKGAVMEGTYPKWRDVVPKSIEKKPINEFGLNAEYVTDFSKTAKLLGKSDSLIRMHIFNAESAIEVHIERCPNFYGVIMPLKPDSETRQWQPDFLNLTKPAEPKPTAI